MAKARRKYRYSNHERFVGLPHFMLGSKAWAALSPNAKALLIEVWRRYNGVNNGEIAYSVREAEEIGLGRHGAANAFRQLVEYGFLLIARDSAFTLKTRDSRLWTITALPRRNGEPATCEFMRWSTPKKNKTQSPYGDTQSPGRDKPDRNAIKEPLTVPAGGPSDPESAAPQSPPGDTYILPREGRSDGAAGHAEPGNVVPIKIKRTAP